MQDFADDDAETRFLANGAASLRSLYQELEPEAIRVYLHALGNGEALGAALERSAASTGAPPPIRVPTLYVGGEDDRAFGRDAAEATGRFVSGPGNEPTTIVLRRIALDPR